MPAVNWNTFENLPGAATTNFEMLCRSIVRRQYGPFGEFRALANQPGLEFHLKLHSTCALGAPGRWFGWQCRWYGLASGVRLGATRRGKIKEAIATTEKELPGITDWILCTRHVLTKADQIWFFGLKTKMKLTLWSAIEVEDHLSGNAEILRETYFGELILTPQILKELHDKAIEPLRSRWRPEIHQIVDAERAINKILGEVGAWSDLQEIKIQIDCGVAEVAAHVQNLSAPLNAKVQGLIEHAQKVSSILDQSHTSLRDGKYEIVHQFTTSQIAPTKEELDLRHQLRAKRHRSALHVANMIADMLRGQRAILALDRALKQKLICVLADAGCGKTQLSAQLTAPNLRRSAGILLRGKSLAAGETLNDLARHITIRGKPLPSFEALIGALDAEAQRSATRLPIVIDGLNEAEDPRDWKDQLASLAITLTGYDNVQVICTLRSAFSDEALPEDSWRLEISGFENDLSAAIQLYFAHYKIEYLDAELPWELLNHPLTLRIFCEVTNPDRKRTVDVTAIPASLTTLFEKYLEQIAVRIYELAPSSFRYFPADVANALSKIGLVLWTERSRNIDITRLRELLGDENRSWDQSLVAALEYEDVLFREPSDQPGRGKMSIAFDALAGHIIADALVCEFSGEQFNKWLCDTKTLSALGKAVSDRHPLATDIFRSAVGLMPRRMNRKQLWSALEGQMRTDALIEAAFLENIYLDQETVAELLHLVRQPNQGSRDLFHRLFVTRSAQAHPLNALFLESILGPMSMADRDVRWSEWLRRDRTAVSPDSEQLAQRWKNRDFKERSDGLRARWVMWTLTSTIRLRRDQATYALYWFGCLDPETLFSLSLESLSINDPYVPERMLAACYGVAMNLWADPRGKKLQEALPSFASRLVKAMFAEGAPHPTFHILARDYALGILELALKIDPNCISEESRGRLVAPYPFASPFPPADEIGDTEIAGSKNSMRMDFENYTLGRLVRNRRNYDFDNEDYRKIRRQIEYRIVKLGYSADRFASIDSNIVESGFHSTRRTDSSKIDRYGKKYSWIAYFEMYGIRQDAGELEGWRQDSGRSPDVDIDPSFPEEPKIFQPAFADLFSKSPTELRKWLSAGPTPDYEELIQREEIDGKPGPWLLLEGYVEENAPADNRRVFSFLRGLLVRRKYTAELLTKFNAVEYPGNSAIPEPLSDHYTYAGEIPWSSHFARDLRKTDSGVKRNKQETFVEYRRGRWQRGISVEIPVHTFGWENYHSQLNQVTGTIVLAPALCEKLGLVNHQGEWDLYETLGMQATIYRETKGPDDSFRSNFLYLRADLMAKYLSSDLDLVWLVWGERNFQFKNFREVPTDAFDGHKHIHRYGRKWGRRPSRSQLPRLTKKKSASRRRPK